MNFRRFVVSSLVSVALLLGATSGSAESAEAASYSQDENVAWAMSLRHPESKTWARGIGKRQTVAYMRTVCFNLDAGDTWTDIGDKGVLMAKKAASRIGPAKAASWLYYAARISRIAVAVMCPQHSSLVPIS